MTLQQGRPLIGVTLGKWYSTGRPAPLGNDRDHDTQRSARRTVDVAESEAGRAHRVSRHSVRDCGAASPHRSASHRGQERDGDEVRPGRAATDRRPARRARAGMKFRGSTDEHACLTLNVWAPTGAPSGPQLPVLVWFPRRRVHHRRRGLSPRTTAWRGSAAGARRRDRHVQLPARRARLPRHARRGRRGQLRAPRCDRGTRVGARQHRGVPAAIPSRVHRRSASRPGGGLVLHAVRVATRRGGLLAARSCRAARRSTRSTPRRARRCVRDALAKQARLTDAEGLRGPPGRRAGRGAVGGDHGLARNGRHDALPPDGRRRRAASAAPVAALARARRRASPMVIGTTTDEMRLFLDRPGPRRRRAKVRPARRALRRRRRGAGATEIVATLRGRARRPKTPTRSGPRCSPTTRCRCPRPRCATRSAAHGPAYSYLLRLGGDRRARRVPRHRHPVHVRQLRRRLGRVRRPGRRRARALERDAQRRGPRSARTTAIPGWPQAPQTMRLRSRSTFVVDDPVRARGSRHSVVAAVAALVVAATRRSDRGARRSTRPTASDVPASAPRVTAS